MKLMVLDGNSLVNRAFFGIKLLTTKDGRYTNAIYGFQNILLNLLAAHKPDAVAIAWDERAPTFRHNAYDGYKATRHGMPEELAQQMPVLKELLTDLGFVQVSKAGWEADDILGTLAAACEAAGGTTLLATGDRDSLQLVDDATTVLLATNKETLPMDPAAIREKYGIEPPQLIDVKSLMGDASDNIPGVPGIGEKTALALISKFGSLQGVYDNIEDKAVKPGQRAKLTANRDKADLSYMLGTIRKDAPIESDPAAYVQSLSFPVDYVSCEYHTAFQNPELVNQLHAVGCKVAFWTVNTKNVVRSLLPLGPDCFVTDRPDNIRVWIAEAEAE